MLLVPRQLLRSGMTGDVPYYGGRFTPAQAWAAAHPSVAAPAPLGDAPGVTAGRAPLPTSPSEAATSEADAKAALRHLRDTGVLTAQEYDELLTRATR
jgi:hypothetical protein